MNRARIAGVFYLMVFVTGGLALLVRGGVGSTAGLIAGVFYIAPLTISRPASWAKAR
jgi:hypothetical protein